MTPVPLPSTECPTDPAEESAIVMQRIASPLPVCEGELRKSHGEFRYYNPSMSSAGKRTHIWLLIRVSNQLWRAIPQLHGPICGRICRADG